MKFNKLSLLIIAFATVLAGHAQAAIIAYEGFDPAPSTVTIVGTGTGTGFSGNWVDSTGSGTINRTNSNTSITAFPSNVTFPAPAGGVARYVDGNFADNSVTRNLSTILDLDSNGSFYLSFLFNDSAANSSAVNREATVFLGSASQRLHVGPSYSDRLTITRNNATNEPFVSPTAKVDSVANFFGQTGTPLLFIVAEFLTQAVGNDTINLKAYSFTPGTGTVDLSPASVTWDVTHSFNGTGTLDQLGMYMEAANGQNPEIDEIRLGQTWADVTAVPEPGSLALLGLGGLGLLGFVRRSKR